MMYDTPATDNAALLWDIFCRVVDNYGDAGVCWRLCSDLASRGHAVRLWIDNPTVLEWMAPFDVCETRSLVQVQAWSEASDATKLSCLQVADVWIEAFGCDLPAAFVAHRAQQLHSLGQHLHKPPVWINLEYLSAQSWVQRCHGLPSPVMHGAATGWTKHFFYPGFVSSTGGLLREKDLPDRFQQFNNPETRRNWLLKLRIAWQGERIVSLFCYEPPELKAVLKALSEDATPTLLLVTAGRSNGYVRQLMPDLQPSDSKLRVHYLPYLTQLAYDELLWVSDFNAVRGEDSVVRALWAGKPFVWHIYPQDDNAHHEKLDAFLDQVGADHTVRSFHYYWNGLPHTQPHVPPALPMHHQWVRTVAQARERLLQQVDLTSQLVKFVRKER